MRINWRPIIIGAIAAPAVLAALWSFIAWGAPPWNGVFRFMLINTTIMGAVFGAMFQIKDME